MPDTKITALTALTAADPANDMMPIVDVSDTTMAASGTTKRISINNILACSPSATLASATISGALGAAGLNVTGATIPANGVYLGSANNLSFSAASTLAMTLNATGLGVGVASPSRKLHVNSSEAVAARFTRSGGIAANNSLEWFDGTNAWHAGVSGSNFWGVSYNSSGAIDNAAIRIDTSGNVGVGVSTFGTSAAKVLAIGTGTEPTTGPAGTVQLFTSTRSASNTIPAIFTEGSGVTNAAITNTTVTNKIAIKVNGTIYYLLATTSAA